VTIRANPWLKKDLDLYRISWILISLSAVTLAQVGGEKDFGRCARNLEGLIP